MGWALFFFFLLNVLVRHLPSILKQILLGFVKPNAHFGPMDGHRNNVCNFGLTPRPLPPTPHHESRLESRDIKFFTFVYTIYCDFFIFYLEINCRGIGPRNSLSMYILGLQAQAEDKGSSEEG